MVQGTHELPEPNTTAINGIDFVVGEHLRASAYIQGSIAKEIRMRFMADEFDDPALLWKKLENVFGEDVVGMGG